MSTTKIKPIAIAIIVLLSISSMTFAQFTINGKGIVFNATDSVYMCAIPDSIFHNDYQALINPDTIFNISQEIEVDSVIQMDSSIIVDTILQYDTTIIELDTIIIEDTIIHIDTIITLDTIILSDTINICDTLFWEHMYLEDSVEIAMNDTVVFKEVLGNKTFRLTACLSDSSEIVFPITFTNLPIVVLNGQFGYDYTLGTVDIHCPDSIDNQSNMAARIKWRGGSTNTANKHKRNYTLKFVKENGKKQKRQFYGLRTHNQWILNAGQVDLARCRNQIAHELWHDIAHKPYYIEQAPNALTSVRGQFIEVILNNEYRGLYSMSENVDEDQMQLMEYDEDNNIIHGQLWKTDSWDGTGMYDIKNYDNTQERYRGFETKYPDFDDVNPTDYSTLYDAINFALNSSDSEFEEYVTEYFDVPVLIDYYLFINVLVARDNNGKNMFWACYDKQTNKKLTIGVWDLDCTIGQNYNDNDPHPSSFGPEVDMRTQNLIKVIDRLRKIPAYANNIQQRYQELSQTHLNADSLTARYMNYYYLFQRGGAVLREEQRWSGDSDIAGLTLNFEEEFEFIKDWIEKRFDYLNNGEFKTEEIPTDIWINEATINSNNQTYNILGMPIKQPTTAGIYIRNGKKIVIQH